MIITARAIKSANPLSAPDFGQDDARYLKSITLDERRAQAIAARWALVDAFEEWRTNPKRRISPLTGPIPSSQHDEILAPYEPLERELRRMERRDDDTEPARAARKARRAKLRSPESWILERGEWGAPLLRPRDPDSYMPEVHTAMAHCESLAVATLSPWRNGVDVERLDRDLLAAWKRLATGRELAQLSHLGDLAAGEFIRRSWVLKESWAKLHGDGLAHRAKQVSLRFDDGKWLFSSPIRVTAHIGISATHMVGALEEDFDEAPFEPCGLNIEWNRIHRDI